MHLLIGLRATHRLADVLPELKAVSSGWVHDEIGMRDFAWQALAQIKHLPSAPGNMLGGYSGESALYFEPVAAEAAGKR